MKNFFLILFLIFSQPLFAVEDFYSFKTEKDKNRFEKLTSELRCLVCQNQNLAESNAPLANDLRDQIYQKVRLGESNREIISYLVNRYGEFILYKPPINSTTIALWFLPLLILILGITLLFLTIRKINESRQ